MVVSSALPVVSMTIDEIGAPAHLCGEPSPATNIPVVHTLLMTIELTSDFDPKEPRKRYEKNGRVTAIILVQKSSKLVQVVQALEQFSRMQSEREQTLVWTRHTLPSPQTGW